MKKILAIDDQIDNLITIKAVIKSRIPNCNVLTALSGQDGINMAIKEQPDAILLDIIMPEMDGYETCKRLKNDDLTKHIPVVMVTAIKTDSESRVKGLNMGADAFLSKPIDAIELTAQVNVMLRIKEAEDKLRGEKELLDQKVKERTKELNVSEKRYHSLFDSSPVPILIHDGKNILDVNPALMSALSIKEKEILIGTDPFSFVHPDDHKKSKERLKAMLKENTPLEPAEFRIITPHNGERTVIATPVPVSFDNQQAYMINYHDITEAKQAEKQIRKLSTAVEQSPSVILITNLEGKMEYVNPKFSELTGYTYDEVIGKNPRILKSGEQSSSVYKEMWKTIKAGKEWRGEFHNKKKNGELFWENVSISPIIDEQGKAINYIKVAEDITDHKRAEQIQKIVYNISNAVSSTANLNQLVGFIQKELGTIIDTTNFYLALYDQQTDTLTLPFFADEHDSFKTLPAEKTITRYVIQTQKSLLANLDAIKKLEDSGEIGRFGADSLLWLGVPLKVEGKVIGVIALQSYTDKNAYSESDKKMLEFISDQISMAILRKKAEEDLISAQNKVEESEKKFRELFEKSGDAVLILKNRKFTDCNQAAVEMLQYNTKEEFLNTIPAQLSPEIQPDGKNSEEKSDEMIELAIKNGTYRFEWDHLRKNGKSFPVEVLLTAISKNNSQEIIHVTWRDITERKKSEKDIINALQKAEESDRLKSAFLANMSHEIRTPMNGILGFSQLLKEPNIDGDEQLKFIKIIEKSGKRMLNIINDLIDISKIEAGQAEVLISDVNINEQVEYLYTFFKPEADKAGLKLSFKNNLSNDLATINSDREKIYAILTNLIKNAIKYTNEGSIEFGYNLKQVAKNNEGQDDPTQIEFYIKDTGIGIAQEKQKAIFDRFVQADLSLSSEYEGAGLGLAITKGYVEILGGNIWVESIEGKGSQFYFTLPYTIQSDQPKTEKTDIKLPKEANQRKLNILIAEDDETSKVFLTALTKSICKKIFYARTGLEAINIYKSNQNIDLILMDIKMPEMDGYEATRKIREFNKNVIIIAQTAYALEGDREKALEAGCNDYISKPTPKGKLLETVWKHLEK